MSSPGMPQLLIARLSALTRWIRAGAARGSTGGDDGDGGTGSASDDTRDRWLELVGREAPGLLDRSEEPAAGEASGDPDDLAGAQPAAGLAGVPAIVAGRLRPRSWPPAPQLRDQSPSGDGRSWARATGTADGWLARRSWLGRAAAGRLAQPPAPDRTVAADADGARHGPLAWAGRSTGAGRSPAALATALAGWWRRQRMAGPVALPGPAGRPVAQPGPARGLRSTAPGRAGADHSGWPGTPTLDATVTGGARPASGSGSHPASGARAGDELPAASRRGSGPGSGPRRPWALAPVPGQAGRAGETEVVPAWPSLAPSPLDDPGGSSWLPAPVPAATSGPSRFQARWAAEMEAT